MKCPYCRGRGAVTKRFLFITWQRPCPDCNGTGQAGMRRPQDPLRDDDWRSRTDDSFSSPSAGPSRERDAAFVAGAGGESGGAGGGASWGDPVIVDPFAADAAGSSDAASDAGVSAEASGSATDDGGGTAY